MARGKPGQAGGKPGTAARAARVGRLLAGVAPLALLAAWAGGIWPGGAWAGGAKAEEGAAALAQPGLRHGWRVTERAPLRPAPGATTEVVIAATSDLHGWIVRDTLFPRKRPGGLAHLAPVIRELRRNAPGLLLVDGGDAMQGAPNLFLTWHRREPQPPLLALMNALGYAAIAVGNHDLQRGTAALARWAGQPGFWWLSANMVGPDGEPLLPPYRVLEREGVRVGILALVTPGTPAWVDPGFLRGVVFQDMEAAAARWLPVLREGEQVDLVVGLLHAGLNGSYDRWVAVGRGLPLPNAAGRIADGMAGFDLIVSGHAHRRLPRRPAGAESPYSVPVVQPGARGEALAVARFHLREGGGRWRVEGMTRELLPPAIRADPALPPAVQADLAATRAWLAEPTRARFRAVPERDTFYGCAGALSHRAATAALLRSTAPGAGEVRQAAVRHPPGPGGNGAPFSLLPLLWRPDFPRRKALGQAVRRAHLYRWIRYDNSLVLASLTGRQMALLLGPLARRKREMRPRFSSVLAPGGLTVRLAPQGTEVVSLTDRATGKVLAREARYPVLLTNYHWNGGGGLAAGALLHPSQKIGVAAESLREAVFAYLSRAPLHLPEPCRDFLE